MFSGDTGREVGRSVEVAVTTGDILMGRKADASGCPIARALARLWPGALVFVGQDVVTVAPVIDGYDPHGWRWSLPQVARDLIYDFDSGHYVAPVRFSMMPLLEPVAA